MNIITETNLVQGYDPCLIYFKLGRHFFIELSCIQFQRYLRKTVCRYKSVAAVQLLYHCLNLPQSLLFMLIDLAHIDLQKQNHINLFNACCACL